MGKIGRNEPCPCGSGKKYKRCCGPGEAALRAAKDSTSSDSAERVHGRIRGDRAIERASTERLWEFVRARDATITAEEFRESLRRTGCLDDLWDEWCAGGRVAGEDADWLAGHELRRRIADDIPTIEGITELIEQGDRCLEQDNEAAALEAWGKAWERVRPWPDEGARSTDRMTHWTDHQVALSNWVQDYADLLGAIFHEELDPEMGARLLAYAREFCYRFPEEDALVRENFRRDAAEVMFALGRVAEGEAAFEKLVADFPQSGWVRVGWGDMYAGVCEWLKGRVQPDHDRAVRLYREGLALLSDPIDKAAVTSRLDELGGRDR